MVDLYGALAAATALALVLERHRVPLRWDGDHLGPWHNLALETLLAPLILTALVVPACVWARARTLRAIVAAALGGIAGLSLVVTSAMVHLLEGVRHNHAGHAAASGSLGLMFGALVLVVAELIAARPTRARPRRGPALRDVVVTGARRTTLRAALVVLGALAVLLLQLALFERHDVRGLDDAAGAARSAWLVADTFGLVALGPVLVVLAATRARRGFPGGLVAGVVGLAAGLAAAIIDVTAHGLERARHDADEAPLPTARIVR